tara:strand:- start:4313 stop:5005 length:693 start_codon:yes stop_codon:yes gene_type:complete
MLDANKKYVLNQIKNSDVSNEPWSHLIVKNFLPKDLYDGVIQETEQYTQNSALKKPNIRAYHIYVNQSASVFPDTPFLKEYYDILLDKDVLRVIENKLSVLISPKDFYSELNLFTQGYNYGEIHPDRSDKAITMLHYLADDGDDDSIGTLLYTPYKNGNQLDVFKDCIKSAPYVSNCVLLFAPKDEKGFKTNHCMANKSKDTFLRKSFQTFWIKEPSDWTKDKQSGRIKL